MSRVPITIAVSDSDHMRDFRFGLVEAEGIEANFLTLELHEIFTRFLRYRLWEVSELSFAKFMFEATAQDPDIIGLPVYSSRQFRLSSFYYNEKSGIRDARDLEGKRVGLPEWAQTAAVYARGWLQHEAGVDLASIDWFQGGTDDPGRKEKVAPNLPKGVTVTHVPDKSLSQMLLDGELDAVMTAGVPSCFSETNPRIKRLFPDYRTEEEAYFDRTGIYPIMHVMAIRKDVVERHPWVPRNLYLAFNESKNNSVRRILQHGMSRYPVPWMAHYADQMKQKMGGDPFPYGIEANRPTLKAFMQWTYEQGVAQRPVGPEEVFAEGVDISIEI